MVDRLTALEGRAIGCLLEKETTTPDHYPLTLNALTLACNQRSNREPVMNVTEAEIQDVIIGLIDKREVMEDPGFGSRVKKYKQRFCNTEFGSRQFDAQQRAILCLLLLRGPQTPGELRTRSGRLCQFTSTQEVEQSLEILMQHQPAPYVVRLAREPGKREHRYQQCIADEEGEMLPMAASTSFDSELEARVDQLERELAQMRAQLSQLRTTLRYDADCDEDDV